jgi:uncharacterized protein (DUF488 family)
VEPKSRLDRYLPSLSAIDRIFTIGHSTHPAGEFLALLEGHGIAVLADVRRYPSSRRLPHFNAPELEQSLEREGIKYTHLPELGGRRDPAPDSPNQGWRVGQFRGYADHMASKEFGAGRERLEELARERPLAVMCAEAQWWRCHRRLLSDALTVRGFEVLHIDSRGRTGPHELTPFAAVEDGKLSYPPAQAELDV